MKWPTKSKSKTPGLKLAQPQLILPQIWRPRSRRRSLLWIEVNQNRQAIVTLVHLSRKGPREVAASPEMQILLVLLAAPPTTLVPPPRGRKDLNSRRIQGRRQDRNLCPTTTLSNQICLSIYLLIQYPLLKYRRMRHPWLPLKNSRHKRN